MIFDQATGSRLSSATIIPNLSNGAVAEKSRELHLKKKIPNEESPINFIYPSLTTLAGATYVLNTIRLWLAVRTALLRPIFKLRTFLLWTFLMAPRI